MENKDNISNPADNLRASLKCPYCGYIMEVEIPQRGCLVFWKCEKCQRMIETPEGQCCVICAFSDKKCPVHKGRVK